LAFVNSKNDDPNKNDDPKNNDSRVNSIVSFVALSNLGRLSIIKSI